MHERLRRRRLPHLDIPGATFFVTACLHGSIPAQGLLDIRNLEKKLRASRPKGRLPQDWRTDCWKKLFVEQERWLDAQPATRHLERPELADIVLKSLAHFRNERYDLIAYVVMPSHFHWLFRPLDRWVATLPDDVSPREVIMHSVKSFTANRCNNLLGRMGQFWQQESYDHCVRDEEELARILDYIELNPVKAGLCRAREDWPYSSAYERAHPMG